jgi:hypothetical protein
VIDTTSASRPIQSIGTSGGLDHQPRVVRPRNLSHINECTNGSERARSHGRTNGVNWPRRLTHIGVQLGPTRESGFTFSMNALLADTVGIGTSPKAVRHVRQHGYGVSIVRILFFFPSGSPGTSTFRACHQGSKLFGLCHDVCSMKGLDRRMLISPTGARTFSLLVSIERVAFHRPTEFFGEASRTCGLTKASCIPPAISPSFVHRFG